MLLTGKVARSSSVLGVPTAANTVYLLLLASLLMLLSGMLASVVGSAVVGSAVGDVITALGVLWVPALVVVSPVNIVYSYGRK